MATTHRLTLEEFLAMPDTEPASEYVRGQVIQKPMPDRSHAAIQLYLGAVLFQFLTRTGLGRAFTELRCIFGPPGGERAWVPDLVVILKEHLTAGRYHHAPPDIAVEIVSPDQSMALFVEKIAFYIQYGVRLVWVIDPRTYSIVVLAPGKESRLLSSGDVLDGGDVLPGFSVAVDDIFAQVEI
jgi:Uma2 family endonuclease